MFNFEKNKVLRGNYITEYVDGGKIEYSFICENTKSITWSFF